MTDKRGQMDVKTFMDATIARCTMDSVDRWYVEAGINPPRDRKHRYADVCPSQKLIDTLRSVAADISERKLKQVDKMISKGCDTHEVRCAIVSCLKYGEKLREESVE